MTNIEDNNGVTLVRPLKPGDDISQETFDNCLKIAKFNALNRMLYNNCNGFCDICNVTKSKSISNGSYNSSIMIVDAFPSEYETYTGCFTDEKGYFLEETLRSFGINRNNLYCTTIIKCFDVKFLTGQNVTDCINRYFLKEVELLKPKKVIMTHSAFQASLKYQIIPYIGNFNYFNKVETTIGNINVELYIMFDIKDLNEQQKESFKQGLHYILQ